jgi:Heterokaryon incompatibility protein (HET)
VYLWIDALCIVQDDEDDSATESSEMAGVYGRSALTLSATMANSVSSGFLQKPETGHYPSILWNDPRSKQTGNLYLRPKTEGWNEVLSVVYTATRKKYWTRAIRYSFSLRLISLQRTSGRACLIVRLIFIQRDYGCYGSWLLHVSLRTPS